jgi:ribosomal peptide maturation radical SAM protein 1
VAKIIPVHYQDGLDVGPAGRETAGDGPTHPACAANPVVLVNMPFAYLYRPTLGLSLLKGLLLERRIPSRLFYANVRFAESIGRDLYFIISTETPDRFTFAAEWLFSGALFEQTAADQEAYVSGILRSTSASEELIRDIVAARGHVDAFLEGCVEEVLADRPSAVVFTSVLQQQFPALALARRIKAISPATLVAIAGTDWEGVMAAEIVRNFPFVDAGIAGEPELVLPELLQRHVAGLSFADLQGVYTPDNVEGRTAYSSAPPVRNLDALPFPDYDDFFEQLDASSVEHEDEPRLQFETSRGCWWGEKQHCTFCGLVGADMTYRSKSAARALAELKHLVKRYPGYQIWATDFIFDMKYFRDLVPELASERLDVELFYEVKSNIRKDQLRMLRDAGVTMLQPGIESFSDPLLAMMRKGSRGLQNIQFLKWCRELGVRPFWNIIWGFPGEPADEYARMASIVPHLTHLEPPEYAGMISLERFSPNHDFAERFGFLRVAPHPAYRHLYPFDDETVAKLARRFVFEYGEPQDVGGYTDRLAIEVEAWQRGYEESALFFADVESRLLVWDFRVGAREPLTVLTGLQRQLYLSCDGVRSRDELTRVAGEAAGCPATADVVEHALAPLLERGLMVRDGTSFLSLAIPLGEYSPSDAVLDRFYELVEQMEGAPGPVVVLSPEPVPVT